LGEDHHEEEEGGFEEAAAEDDAAGETPAPLPNLEPSLLRIVCEGRWEDGEEEG
jgi:hypothetical protein